VAHLYPVGGHFPFWPRFSERKLPVSFDSAEETTNWVILLKLSRKRGNSMKNGNFKPCVAEFLGTFWLVLGGCGSAVLAAAFPSVGIGLLGVAFAFGLTVLTMAYAVGHISGCHLNPAVSVGLVVGGRFPARKLLSYIVSQVFGAIVAAGVLYVIASGKDGFTTAGGFASNGYGEHSPGGYSMLSGFVTEVVMTAMFLLVILATTDKCATLGFAPIAIGLALTIIHLVSIPVTNTSVNPARSTGVALFVGGWAVAQLWLFWVAPIAGAMIGALLYRAIAPEQPAECKELLSAETPPHPTLSEITWRG
jgi:aquaporin Z